MKKKAFAQIEYINCSPDYTKTICELNEITEHVECIRFDNEDLDIDGYNQWKEKGFLPEIKISIIMLTDPEYLDWFTKNVESTA